MGNVPQRLKNFTGREDLLARLRETLSSEITVVVPHTLQGYGGVGKTALAIEYAHRYGSEYDLIWWIAVGQPMLARASLADLARRLELPSAIGKSVDGAADAALEALRLGSPVSRWLLIFDNADQPDDLQDSIPQGPGHVLITSRNPRWEVAATKLAVDVFPRNESLEFLNKRIPGGIEDSEANELAEELGDLPLALEQAGAFQAETGMAVGTYLRLLKDEAGKILGVGKPLEYYPLSMTAAWRVSVAQLSERLPSAVALLRTCAFFGPEPIPLEVFQHGAQAGDIQISELTADPIALALAVRELARFGLVRIDRRTIVVHRLVQALLREELSETERERYRHDAHVLLGASSPKDPDNRAVWPRYNELVAHVTSRTTDLPSCGTPAIRAFALEVVRYLYRFGDFGASYSLAERLIRQWTEDSGPEADVVIDAKRHLGNALRELGRYSEAYAVDIDTLELSRRILGERDRLTLAMRNSLGADLRAHGDFAEARERDEESLILHTEVFGASNPQTLRVMNNLALDYGLNSDYEAARTQHQRTYLLRRDAIPAVSPTELLSSWSGLARALRLCGNYSAACDVGAEARDYGQEMLTADHYLTLRAAIDQAIALRFLATSLEDALALAADTHSRCNALFGPGTPDTLAAAISLTNIRRTMGRTDEALSLAESTVARYPHVYGPEHPYSHGCAGNLALMRRVAGDPAGARQLNEAALVGLDARLGRDHHYSLTVAMNLASDLHALGDAAGALRLNRDALTRLRSLLGESHPVTLGCAANMGADLRAEGLDEEADRLSGQTLGLYRETLGERHPDTMAALEGRRLDFDFDPPPI